MKDNTMGVMYSIIICGESFVNFLGFMRFSPMICRCGYVEIFYIPYVVNG